MSVWILLSQFMYGNWNQREFNSENRQKWEMLIYHTTKIATVIKIWDVSLKECKLRH
jgi:hypothetical protein